MFVGHVTSRLQWTGRVERKDDDMCDDERLRELDRGGTRGRPGGIVLEVIWRVLACPVRMCRIGINGD